MGDDRDRLTAKLEPQPNGCWYWTGRIEPQGYGRVGYKGISSVPVHRAIYDALVGPIPEGYTVDHTCHTEDLTCPGGAVCMHRRCGNPRHLEAVTLAENIRRGSTSRRTHCPQGHPYDERNTYRWSAGRRYCVACYTAFHGYPPVRQAVHA